MAFALLFCSILVLLPDREKTRRERKPYNNVNRLLLEKSHVKICLSDKLNVPLQLIW